MTTFPTLSPHIRRAGPQDLNALLRLEESFPESDRVTRRNLLRQLRSPSVDVLLFEDREVLGGLVLLFRKGLRIARIYSISVLPTATGRGIGQALLQASIPAARARNCDRLRLEVRASNARAISLYERSGFCVIGEKPSYYDDGETALILELSLCQRQSSTHE